MDRVIRVLNRIISYTVCNMIDFHLEKKKHYILFLFIKFGYGNNSIMSIYIRCPVIESLRKNQSIYEIHLR